MVNNKIHKTMVIDVDDKVTAKKVPYNKENLIEYELNSRDSRIGEITNVATSILNRVTTDETYKRINEDNISLLRLLQGKEIDSIKTGVRWKLPTYLRNALKKIPYFLLYNYPQKLNCYFKTRQKNKTAVDKKQLNAYHSPSPMNELCEYINRWEQKKLLWNNSQINTGCYLINHDIILDDKELSKKLRAINRDFIAEWQQWLKLKDKNPLVDLNQCINKYRDIILQLDDNREKLANYYIDVCYASINTNKTLCWSIFSDIILQNLANNSPKEKYTIITEANDMTENAFEFLGKYYIMIEGEKSV